MPACVERNGWTDEMIVGQDHDNLRRHILFTRVVMITREKDGDLGDLSDR